MCQHSSSQSSNGFWHGLSKARSLSRPWLLINLAMALVLLIATGCENVFPSIFAKTPECYIPAGKCMEIREGVKIKGWQTGPDGKPVKCYYRAYPGCNVGPGVPSRTVPALKESEVK